jgi:multisubunit Na+/H+ antiporter MnhB subunit
MSALNESFQTPPPPAPETAPRAPRPVKLRPIAIGIFVIGLVLCILLAAKLIPGGVWTGVLVALMGILLFVFSFIPLPVIPDAEAPLSFFDKVTGIFYEPTRVFRNLRSHPHWVGAFVVAVVLSAIYSFVFVNRITPERITDYMTQKVAEMPAPFTPPPAAIEQMKNDQLAEMKNPVQRAGAIVKMAVGLFLQGALAAAICLLAVLVFGGRINYWQALAVVFYTWIPIMMIQKLLGLVILYLKSPDDLHPILNQETTLQDNLGILFSPAEHPVLFVLASFIGLTWFYLLWLRAKGLHKAGTKVSSSAGWAGSLAIYLLLMFYVTVLTLLFPQFIS